jgi:hypothetical protein
MKSVVTAVSGASKLDTDLQEKYIDGKFLNVFAAFRVLKSRVQENLRY